MDVKVIPRRCTTDPELRLFQYTAIDEFSRLCFSGILRILQRRCEAVSNRPESGAERKPVSKQEQYNQAPENNVQGIIPFHCGPVQELSWSALAKRASAVMSGKKRSLMVVTSDQVNGTHPDSLLLRGLLQTLMLSAIVFFLVPRPAISLSSVR